jgi:hypothetical protein
MARRTHEQARSATTESAGGTDRDALARLAYELYEQRGCADGRDLDDWLQAEVILRRGGRGGRASAAR